MSKAIRDVIVLNLYIIVFEYNAKLGVSASFLVANDLMILIAKPQKPCAHYLSHMQDQPEGASGCLNTYGNFYEVINLVTRRKNLGT